MKKLEITRLEAECQAEAKRRLLKAMEHVEVAQGELTSACAELSCLIGAIPQWRVSSKLYERVRKFWYRLDAFRAGGKYKLDGLHSEIIEKQLAQTASVR